ncbi:MAG: CDP-diacylglycerol--glycerol-3-phosphate 3-phosphatidyltransferase [Clostridiales bacterium]|nr:CDP-diacylglycerol--glycerol-3-phosphate 3-phosphatidyltransferase [Clostridiales bacterium]
MNLPNKLTVARIVCVPIFVILYVSDMFIAACAVFVIAAFTDFLDGQIARKHGLVTNFGKIMDPLADKILVYSAFCLMVADATLPAWTLIVILLREFTVSGMRTVAAAEGIVIAAGASGKAKTILQMIAVPLLIIRSLNPVVDKAGYIIFWASLAMTVYSGAEYVIKNIGIFSLNESSGTGSGETKKAGVPSRAGALRGENLAAEIAQKVIERLKEHKISLAAAESMTGGMFAKEITDRPGVSAFFDRSCVTYSDEAKMKDLGVLESTLAEFGAISAQCAGEMAEGLHERTGCELCISVTGNAGPDPAEGKEVGEYYIGIWYAGTLKIRRHVMSSGDRSQIRKDACNKMFEAIYDILFQ